MKYIFGEDKKEAPPSLCPFYVTRGLNTIHHHISETLSDVKPVSVDEEKQRGELF